MSKNAEGWVRHRGGKCPVEIGDIIDVRHRSGEVISCVEMEGSGWYWDHHGNSFDIMAFRLHKPAEHAVNMEAFSECVNTLGDSHADVMASVLSRIEGPLQWRDRIAEIDATTQALTTERAELVQNLASEGFALIGRMVEIVSDVEIEEWQRLALDGRKIMAIKEYRSLTGSSLRNALDVIDAFIADNA